MNPHYEHSSHLTIKIFKMNKSTAVPSVRDASAEFQRLLYDRKYQEFWCEFQACSSVRYMHLMAVKSIGTVIRKAPNLTFSDASILMKLSGQIVSCKPTGSSCPMRFLMPEVETLLLSWIPDKIDDVCLFIQTVLADKTLATFGTELVTGIFKGLSYKIVNLSEQGLRTMTVEEVFESAKNMSYCVETMTEEFITEPSTAELHTLSTIYMNSLDSLLSGFSKFETATREVVWTFGRRTSWMKWLCRMKKRDLKLHEDPRRPHHPILPAAIEARTSDMLLQNDWDLYEFCYLRRNWREAASVLSRIFLESLSSDIEKICKAFLNLKFSVLTDTRMPTMNPSLTLFELAAKQFKILDLCSSTEFVAVGEDEFIKLASAEHKIYKNLDEVLFGSEIEVLSQVLKINDDRNDSIETDCSCESV